MIAMAMGQLPHFSRISSPTSCHTKNTNPIKYDYRHVSGHRPMLSGRIFLHDHMRLCSSAPLCIASSRYLLWRMKAQQSQHNNTETHA